MYDWIISKFIIQKDNGDLMLRRKLCGNLSGAVGVVLNAILGAIKIILGIVTGSVALIADAINNLSDAVASLVTLIGFKIAHSKSDAEHPFGHARAEYMTGVVVSALIIAVGIKLLFSSYGKIVEKTPLETSLIAIIILFVMMLAKIWLYLLNMHLSKLIDSASLKATGIDSRNDVIATAVVLISLLLDKFFSINIDGIAGMLVGAFIVFSGLKMLGETASPLLGKKADPKMVKAIEDIILSHTEALGLHDLIIHDYGPGHTFASVHIEIDSRIDIFKTHAVVDEIEQEVLSQLGVELVGHMDPLDTQDKRIVELNKTVEEILDEIEGAEGFHDLRIISNDSCKKIQLDVVISHKDAESTQSLVQDCIEAKLCEIAPDYDVLIAFDLDYTN